MENQVQIIGADVSKGTIDLFLHSSGKHLRISNDKQGFRSFMDWLDSLGIMRTDVVLVMEHTGLYPYLFEKFLFKKEVRFAKVNAKLIRMSSGILRGKSDKADAKRIAEYGVQKIQELRWERIRSNASDRLKLLLMARNQFVKVRTSFMNMREEIVNIRLTKRDLIMTTCSQAIVDLERKIKRLEKAMEDIIAQDEALRRNYALVKSVTGVGAIVGINLLVKTNNFEWFDNPKTFACYCGVAPFPHTSGSSIRGRTRVSHYADKQMKTLLDLAAKVAIQHDPELKAYYARRVAAGKPKMSAINVVRNKIIGRIFAVIKRQAPFNRDVHLAA